MSQAELKPLGNFEVWFLTGSQHLYGESVLEQVAADSRPIAGALEDSAAMPVHVIYKPVLSSSDAIFRMCLDVNASATCIGVIAWMHTFSPAKLWIPGLTVLQKPLLHLHTQFNRELPWDEIDMEFMNLNQSAHGDREFGFMEMRMRLGQKTVVGHWSDPAVVERIAWWSRAAAGWHEAQSLKVARFGDNMRNVAVTEGDKVEAQIRFGFSVNGYGVSELVDAVAAVPDHEVTRLVCEYDESYDVAPNLSATGEHRAGLRDAARLEAGLRAFLQAGDFGAFTDTFEDLSGLTQLPGIAVQRLMAEGYGFGAEGDWKTAALVRILKVMSLGLEGGTSFMEDYTYQLCSREQILGAHMLEICPSIAGDIPSCQIHPLSIGGKGDPVRLVFTAAPGPAIVVALLDLGDRFRLLANVVETIEPESSLPKLPVARALWRPLPDLKTAAECWLLAGGPHHTVYTRSLPMEPLQDFADIAKIELLTVDALTRVSEFKKELRWNQAYYHLARGV